MILMAEAKPRQSNMRSEGFFIRGRGQYTIFLYSRPERAKFRLAPRPESWHFLAAVQKKIFVFNKFFGTSFSIFYCSWGENTLKKIFF